MTQVQTLELEQLHPLLRRQVKKYLSVEQMTDPAILKFIEASNDSYMNYERDKDLFEHAVLLNEREYALINKQLTEEVTLRKQAFEKLAEAIDTLDVPEGYSLPHFSADDMLGLVDFLKKQIAYQKQIETELIHAKETAESSTRAKSEFLSVMSHEIRTPLNAIVGLVYLMRQEEYPPNIAENLNTLQFATDNLYVLINDILDFSKIEAGKIELEQANFDLKKLISNIQKSYTAKAQENGNTIELNIDEAVPGLLVGDALRLSQIISNLVSNAVKFTQNGVVTIHLKLQQLQEDTASLMLAVEDTGIGIPKEQHQRIFDLFTQASSKTTRRYGGTGLGLVICRRLLQLYDTQIMLESEPGKGSTFFFSIHLKTARQQDPIPAVPPINHLPRYPLEGVKVLLVEDYFINIKVAVKFFERWKVHYDIAENGLIGVEKAAQNQYDLILMDIQMPEMDGYTATRKIRSFNPDIPIIAVTASATISDKTVSYEAGMNDFVLKPFNPMDLSAKIAHYAGREL